jgi:hypothetical protein
VRRASSRFCAAWCYFARADWQGALAEVEQNLMFLDGIWSIYCINQPCSPYHVVISPLLSAPTLHPSPPATSSGSPLVSTCSALTLHASLFLPNSAALTLLILSYETGPDKKPASDPALSVFLRLQIPDTKLHETPGNRNTGSKGQAVI